MRSPAKKSRTVDLGLPTTFPISSCVRPSIRKRTIRLSSGDKPLLQALPLLVGDRRVNRRRGLSRRRAIFVKVRGTCGAFPLDVRFFRAEPAPLFVEQLVARRANEELDEILGVMEARQGFLAAKERRPNHLREIGGVLPPAQPAVHGAADLAPDFVFESPNEFPRGLFGPFADASHQEREIVFVAVRGHIAEAARMIS